MQQALLCRPATMADAEILFEWRNHPSTYRLIRTPEPVAWPDHLAWLSRAIAAPDRCVLVYEAAGSPVGVGRLDWRDGETEMSWTVAPERRGEGLGTALVRSLAAIAGPAAVAEIHRDNTASRRAAHRAGLTYVGTAGPWQRWVRPPADRSSSAR